MGKESGLGWTTFSVDDAAAAAQDIRGDTTALQFSTPRAVADWTGLDKSAIERGLLLADASITANGIFNDEANLSHAVFKTIPSTSVTRTVAIGVSGQTLSMEMLLTDYQMNRDQGGNFTWTVPGSLASGLAPTWS